MSALLTEQVTVVPPIALRLISNDPPITPARYCITRSPMPRDLCKLLGRPLPLSVTESTNSFLLRASVMATRLAFPCLTALVTASWAIR